MLRARRLAALPCVLLALGLGACSSRLDLGHDIQGGVTAPGQTPPDALSPASCDGVPCFAGPVLELARSAGNGKGLVVDADTVFWAAPAAGALMVTPKDGGPTTAISTPAGGPYRVAADDTNVYFTSAVGGYVAAMPKATQAITMLVSGEPQPESLLVASEGVYFADQQVGTLKRVALDGSAVETLPTAAFTGRELGLDAQWLYYADSGVGEIHAMDRVSEADTLLSAGRAHPLAPLPRGDWLYFLELGTEEASYADGRLLRMPRMGGTVEVLLDGLDAPSGLAADSAAIYLCTRGTALNGYRGRVARLADDGAVSTLATDQAEPFAIAVDAAAVYWTVDSDSALHSLNR